MHSQGSPPLSLETASLGKSGSLGSSQQVPRHRNIRMKRYASYPFRCPGNTAHLAPVKRPMHLKAEETLSSARVGPFPGEAPPYSLSFSASKGAQMWLKHSPCPLCLWSPVSAWSPGCVYPPLWGPRPPTGPHRAWPLSSSNPCNLQNNISSDSQPGTP